MPYRQLYFALLCCGTWTAGWTSGLGLADVQPDPVRLLERERKDVSVVLVWNSTTVGANTTTTTTTTLSVISKDPDLLRVIGDEQHVALEADGRLEANVTLEGVFLGRTSVLFTVCAQDMDCAHVSYPVAVLRNPSVLQKMFPFLIVAIVAINYINMGCQIDISAVWSTLKRPLAPAVGCCCQFIFMPLISYGIGLLLLKDAVQRFGFFLLGCSPGGNSSNLWTLMFDGDVTLSITMTFVSTIASIGMMPLWIFTLGRHIAPEDTGGFKIPFDNIAGSLAGLALPLSIGMLVRRFKPEWAQKSQKYAKPVTLVILIAILVLSCTVNRYIFLLMTWQTYLSGALVAWSAYVFGALAAVVVRLKKPQIIAVAIEVAFQNGGIATVILYTSLPEPDSDTVIVPVVCQLILQGVPLYVILLATKIGNVISTRGGAEVDKEKADEMKPLPATNCTVVLKRNADGEKPDDKTNRESDVESDDSAKAVSGL